MTVGAKTCGIGNWVTNMGIVVGSSGTGRLDEGEVNAEMFGTVEVDLSPPQPFDVRASDTMARINTPPDETAIMRFQFVAMVRLPFWVRRAANKLRKNKHVEFVSSVFRHKRIAGDNLQPLEVG